MRGGRSGVGDAAPALTHRCRTRLQRLFVYETTGFWEQARAWLRPGSGRALPPLRGCC